MKHILILSLLLCKTLIAQQATNDTDSSSTGDLFVIVEQQAEFPGGVAELYKYVLSNIKYPELVIKNNINGTCYIKFIIDADGSVTHTEVLKGILSCKECDEEALRVIRSMPKWTPAKIKGKPVKSAYNLPIRFKPGDKK